MKRFLKMIKKFNETKAGRIIKKSIEYFFIVAVSLWIGTLFDAFVYELPLKIIFNPSPLVSRIIISVLVVATVFVSIYFFVSKESYQTKHFDIKEVIICSIILFVLHHIYAFALGYVIYSAGPVYDFGCLLYYGNYATSIKHYSLELPMYIRFISFVIFQFAAYFPAVFLGEYMGVKRRKKHEKQLIEYCKSNNNKNY